MTGFLRMPPAAPGAVRLTLTENGRATDARVFRPGTLLGVLLTLPRETAADRVTVSVRDGEGLVLCAAAGLCRAARGRDTYAAMLETDRLPAGRETFFLRVSLFARGRAFRVEDGGPEDTRLVPDDGGDSLPFFLKIRDYPLPVWPENGFLWMATACRAQALVHTYGAAPFASLFHAGVRGIWLTSGESPDAAVTEAAAAQGLTLFSGGTDDGLSPEAGRALAAFLTAGDPVPLSVFLRATLARTSEPARTPLLCAADGGRLRDVLREAGGEEAARLAFLILSTLPGLPVIADGEEDDPAVRAAAALRYREPLCGTGDFRLHRLTRDLLVFSRADGERALVTVVWLGAGRLTVSAPEGFTVLAGGRGRKECFSLRSRSGCALAVSQWGEEPPALRVATP